MALFKYTKNLGKNDYDFIISEIIDRINLLLNTTVNLVLYEHRGSEIHNLIVLVISLLERQFCSLNRTTIRRAVKILMINF